MESGYIRRFEIIWTHAVTNPTHLRDQNNKFSHIVMPFTNLPQIHNILGESVHF